MAEIGFDSKEVVASALSWAAYGAALVFTKNPDNAEKAKEVVEALGGVVTVEQRDSISRKVSELCKKSWDTALKKNNAMTLRSELRNYNFAEDPFHWDSVYTIQGRINKACRKKKKSIIEIPYKQISTDVVELLGRMMDNDPDLKLIQMYTELLVKIEAVSRPVKIQTATISDEKAIPTGGAFALSHPVQYFGHEEEIADVLEWIGTYNIIIVYGEGGIGKTEFCREVLSRVSKKDPRTIVNAVNLIECRDYGQFIRRVAGVLGIAVATDDKAEKIERLVMDRLRGIKGILYLDNLEDVMSETKTEKTERRKVLDFLRNYSGGGMGSVLISSRFLPSTDFRFKDFMLEPLDDSAAVSLFTEIWGSDEEEAVRDFVVKDLNKYPLAIILTSKQKRYVRTIEKLKKLWTDARQKIRVEGMGNERHESVETALNITYEELNWEKKSRQLWVLFTLFPEDVDVSVVESIIPDCYDALRKLIDLSVVHEDGEKMWMLPLLREYIKDAGDFKDDLTELTGKVVEYYSGMFDTNRDKRGSTEDQRAVQVLPNALYFMGYMVSVNDEEVVGEMHKRLCRYYQERPYEAIEVVGRASEQLCFDDERVKANITEHLGDLEMRTDKLEEAERHYVEAEALYRRIQEDLGLANVLQAMGDLYQGKKLFSKGIRHYEEAIGLYRKTKDFMGLAYSNTELCYCYAKLNDTANAIIYAQQVLEICEVLPYEDVKDYCLRKIWSVIDK